VKEEVFFACFADGSPSIKKAGDRIMRQAEESEIFKECHFYDKKLLNELKPISKTVSELMQKKNSGFGHFVWKPILLDTLLQEIIPENAILVYCDSGTELVTNKFAKKRMLKLISRLGGGQPILAFQTNFPEYSYTKYLCLSLLDDSNDQNTNQIEATSIFIRNCEEARSFIGQWKELAVKDNFLFINNILEIELEGFIEHRWDQSIFSVLYKNKRYKPLRMAQVMGYLEEEGDISIYRRFMFNSFFLWQIRNRTGKSILRNYQKLGLFSLVIYPMQYLIKPTQSLSRIMRIAKSKVSKKRKAK
jgi:hypothetical protein